MFSIWTMVFLSGQIFIIFKIWFFSFLLIKRAEEVSGKKNFRNFIFYISFQTKKTKVIYWKFWILTVPQLNYFPSILAGYLLKTKKFLNLFLKFDLKKPSVKLVYFFTFRLISHIMSWLLWEIQKWFQLCHMSNSFCNLHR